MSINDNHDKTEDGIDEEELKDEDFENIDDDDSTSTEDDEDDNSSEEDDDEGSEEGSGKKKVDTSMDKFKDKKPEEIIEMYRNLEKQVDSLALKKAQKLFEKAGVKVSDKDVKKAEEKVEEDSDFDLTDEEIKKMTPKQFAEWTDKRITAKATKIASQIIARSNDVRENVKREIAEATKLHPHLKTNKSYRDLVLDRIEASKSRGKTITLKEACKQVDEAMGIKPGEKKDEEKKPEEKKKPRTEVEKTEGTDGDKNETEDEKVLSGIKNAGGTSRSPLGGLGI